MERKPLSMSRKIQFLVVIGVVFLLAMEGLIRIASGPPWVNRHYVEISGDFAELDSLIADAQKTPPPKYYDEFLYAAGPVSTGHINFTDYFSARLTPDSAPLSTTDNIVWTFGGSTMENTETTDTLTIANTWAKAFNSAMGPTHVKNFGSGGFFSSYELIKFQKLLRETPAAELPTMAIFYDGFNDALYGFQYGAGSLQKDLSLKLQALVEHRDFALGSYAASRLLSNHSRLWERTGARLVENTFFPLPELMPEAGRLDQTVRVYSSNVKMTKAVCEAFQIRCFFVLQPLLVTKTPLAPVEQEVLAWLEGHPRFGPEGTRFIRDFYERAAGQFTGDDSFIDASSILDGRTQADFYDLGHTGAQTAPVIGAKTAQQILTRLGVTDHGVQKRVKPRGQNL